ncbi:MAG: hypothetical protein NT150_00315 [Bacteroidetes bacterium]|nr:hypothetical protein [Bacteroidota bacterium]
MNKFFQISFLGMLLPIISYSQTCEHCGIGDVAPDAKLEVKSCGTGTGKVFHITDSLSAHLLTMFDYGKFGLGTPSPGAILDVRGNASVVAV